MHAMPPAPRQVQRLRRSSSELRGMAEKAPPATNGSLGAGRTDSRTELIKEPSAPQKFTRYEQLPYHLLKMDYAMNSCPIGSEKSCGYVGAKLQTAPQPNYDDEARKLWARLNIDPTEVNGRYNPLDAIWRHPETGAKIYVGNEIAAKTLSILQDYKITHIVNCTDSIPNFHESHPNAGSPFIYLNFDICGHPPNEQEAVSFAQPMLDFISEALARGENVLVHCLAGAHRAGTTGVICLMHFAKLSAQDATLMAKKCRPIIDPIADFPKLLARLERGWHEPA